MWIFLTIASASLLGIYDIFKKWSLQENAVIPVLFFSTLTSACLFIPLLLYSHFHPGFSDSVFYIQPEPLRAHIYFFLKSVIVGLSWIFAYFALKHLPVTIASPIRSSGPIWTLFGALAIYGESMNLLQWTGLLVTIGFYYGFSVSGRKEGITFYSNKWIVFMVLATIIAAISGLYDKYIIRHYDRFSMQCWFSIYMAIIYAFVLLFVWLPNRKKQTLFVWRYSILWIGVTLTLADFLYFFALSKPGALISVIATVRRSGVVISFTLGALIFKERNIKEKAMLLLGILLGIFLIVLGSRS